MKKILLRKQESIFILTKSLIQYPYVRAQTSDEIQPSENFGNSFVVFDEMLLSKQESNNGLFFKRGRQKNFDNNYVSQNYFHLPKNTILKNSNMNIVFKQTLRDIILLFHDIAGLDVNPENGRQLCRKASENEYDYLQMERNAEIGEGRYTIRNCKKNFCIKCTPETEIF